VVGLGWLFIEDFKDHCYQLGYAELCHQTLLVFAVIVASLFLNKES